MEKTATPRNVIFIMTDQQRYNSLAQPNPYGDFPAMRRLRAQSASFEDFYTAALPCVPSRHAFLTGRTPWQLGCWGNAKFSEEGERTWMSLLRDEGYRCVSVGKTHMIHAGSYHIPVDSGDTFGALDGWNHFEKQASPAGEDAYFDVKVSQRACRVMDQLKQDDSPFALFIGFHAPHEPYSMPGKYLSFRDADSVSLPHYADDAEYDGRSAFYQARRAHFARMFGELTEEKVRTGIAGYGCMLKMVDDCLDTVLRQIDALGLAEDTLIVFTSDHGELLGEHHIFNKAATFHDAETHIPFLMRFPDGRFAGKSINGLASSLDFVPTLLDIMGVTADAHFCGESLVPALETGKTEREAVVSAVDARMMLRTDTHLIWYDAEHDDGELYMIAEDPHALHNRYNDPDCAALRDALLQRMLRERMLLDRRDSRPARKDRLRLLEVKASQEPEVV